MWFFNKWGDPVYLLSLKVNNYLWPLFLISNPQGATPGQRSGAGVHHLP
jgi:hypothetical protein